MKINVVNKYKHTPTPADVYIGRGSPLGNPFPARGNTTRETACALYASWFHTAGVSAPVIQQYLDHIKAVAKEHGEVNLVCFCKPKQCHGDTIKAYLESQCI